MDEFTRSASPLAFGLAFGLALGLAFFGGLWWTVRTAVASTRPARWFLGSALLRTGLVLGGFGWFATRFPDPQPLLACLAGFGLAQLFAMLLPRRPSATRQAPGPGGAP